MQVPHQPGGGIAYGKGNRLRQHVLGICPGGFIGRIGRVGLGRHGQVNHGVAEMYIACLLYTSLAWFFAQSFGLHAVWFSLPLAEITSVVLSSVPVSYTHLDVYKRQGPIWSREEP